MYIYIFEKKERKEREERKHKKVISKHISKHKFILNILLNSYGHRENYKKRTIIYDEITVISTMKF